MYVCMYVPSIFREAGGTNGMGRPPAFRILVAVPVSAYHMCIARGGLSLHTYAHTYIHTYIYTYIVMVIAQGTGSRVQGPESRVQSPRTENSKH